MRDQIAAAERAGVRAASLNSSNVTEWDSVLKDLKAGKLDVLLVSPERLNNPQFRDEVLPQLLAFLGLIVVDEAHCISDWGHDFRPDYRRIGRILSELPHNTPVLATTATANSRVVADVAEQLGDDTTVVRGELARDSLRLGVLNGLDASARIAWLSAHLNDFTGSGIVYTLTVSAAEDITRMLREQGHEVRAYTGRTDAEERAELEQQLKDNRLKALVATSALGMGFDKPDLGFVVHIGAPSSAVAYYQQVGRAGRATDSADVLLLPGAEDEQIWEYFATASMPNQDDANAVLAALAEADGPLSVARLETLVGTKRSRLNLLLKTLEVEDAVSKVKGGYVSTGLGWTYDRERYEKVAAVRAEEARAMLDYEATGQCRDSYPSARRSRSAARAAAATTAPLLRRDLTTAPGRAGTSTRSACHRTAQHHPAASRTSGFAQVGSRGSSPRRGAIARLSDLGQADPRAVLARMLRRRGAGQIGKWCLGPGAVGLENTAENIDRAPPSRNGAVSGSESCRGGRLVDGGELLQAGDRHPDVAPSASKTSMKPSSSLPRSKKPSRGSQCCSSTTRSSPGGR